MNRREVLAAGTLQMKSEIVSHHPLRSSPGVTEAVASQLVTEIPAHTYQGPYATNYVFNTAATQQPFAAMPALKKYVVRLVDQDRNLHWLDEEPLSFTGGQEKKTV